MTGVVQAASKLKLAAKSRIRARVNRINMGVKAMWLLALEACGATALFIFIVWWTMFSGRKPKKSPTKLIKDKKD
ncbi:MAG: hypothetical protein Q7J77_02665 [Undibacterium sp.]|nr:hypothetical protein [Undibacterium sp.]